MESDSLVIEGAKAVEGHYDKASSPYFKSPDFFNLRSNETLTILEKFQTYQQTREHTCGPAAMLMVLHYFHFSANELYLATKIGSSEELGTNTKQVQDYFKSLGWKTHSSLDGPEGSLKMLRENLKNGIPTLVEWVDWGGHWQVVIGYDTMGTPAVADDVIIFADPYDTSDHAQDGYYVFSAERFESMWFDAHLLPVEMRNRPYVYAWPGK